ncbi:MAG: ABC transporter ATP-binding protein [Phycisphaerales bacterium]
MFAVDLHDITKTYRGGVKALRGVSLQVGQGEIVGLLGPNGAGKSTLVKIMMTVVRPTSASGTILGAPVGNSEILAQVGYLPEHHRFPAYLTGRQVIDFFGALGRVPRATRRTRTQELLALVGMDRWGDKRVTTYSKGMQQRIGIAAALINDPRLVVLDEPTDGVDPVGRREIRDMLLHLRSQGRSVLVNSHLLSEVEQVADRVAIMNQGTMVAQGSVEELTRASQRFELEALDAPETIVAAGRTIAAVGAVGAAAGAASTAGRRIFVVDTADPAQLQPFIDALRWAGASIVRVERVRESLEDLFVRSVVDERGRAEPGAKQ